MLCSTEPEPTRESLQDWARRVIRENDEREHARHEVVSGPHVLIYQTQGPTMEGIDG